MRLLTVWKYLRARAESLGNSTHLEELDLSNNNLNGYGHTHMLLPMRDWASAPRASCQHVPGMSDMRAQNSAAGCRSPHRLSVQEAPVVLVTMCMVP